ELVSTLQLPDFMLATSLQQRSAADGIFCGYCHQLDDFEGAASHQPVPCPNDAWCSDPSHSDPSYPVCGQRGAGAFGHDVALIEEDGTGPGRLADGGVHPTRLVGIFCIPPTFSQRIDPVSSLPGPGAVALTGDVQLVPAAQSTCQ